MKRKIEEKLLNPKPGSKAAAAKEFGIDLTLLVENLRLTSQKRVENLQLFEQNIKTLLSILIENRIDFVVTGETSSFFYGWKTIASKLEICCLRTDENLKKFVSALSRFNPLPRNLHKNSPYLFDEHSLQNTSNFTFETTIGAIDLLSEVAGVGNYEEVLESSEYKELFGSKVRVLTLEGLIKAKRAAGRTKDLLVLPELEALREVLSDEEE